jgi:NAD(P)-dependent dehydrogenase (short-subunit alcohol dehydrogenase family)
MDIAGKRFLVIGGSGVLGSGLVSALRERGATVLATASSNETAARIPAVAEVRLLLDYTDPASVTTLCDYLVASTALDGVINAAGLVAFGPAASIDQPTQARLFASNALGPMQLLAALYPLLQQSATEGNQPVIVNLTGVVAEQPLANIAAYSASKTAIAGYLQALAREWRREGIRVISANPPHTETGLAQRAIAGVAPNFGTGLTPEAVVSRIIAAIEQDEKELPSSAF